MLVSGWKTTPAGRQLSSGDLILSGKSALTGSSSPSPTLATLVTRFHIVNLATEKEIVTFPLEQPGAALRSRRMANGCSFRAGPATR